MTEARRAGYRAHHTAACAGRIDRTRCRHHDRERGTGSERRGPARFYVMARLWANLQN